MPQSRRFYSLLCGMVITIPDWRRGITSSPLRDRDSLLVYNMYPARAVARARQFVNMRGRMVSLDLALYYSL